MLKIILIEGRYIVVQASGKLEAEDYSEIEKAIEEIAAKFHSVRMLLMLKDFEGWAWSGIAEEFRFGWKHRSQIEKLAIVGEKSSQEKLAWFVEVFSSTIVEFFLEEEGEHAWKWLHEDENEEYYSWAVMPFVHGPDSN